MKVKVINKSKNALPVYETEGSAGMDLRACIEGDTILLEPGQRVLINTGLQVEIPKGYELQIRPRSGMAIKHGISIVNSPGTVDCVPFGTKIKTLNGDVLVEDIFNSEDKKVILSFNEAENVIEEDVVSDMWTIEGLPLIKIITEENDTIEIPEDKKVFTNRGWVCAKNLKLKDKILKY